ncbi:NAD-glutamate dehydrogenase OS=Streptomyces rimosus subsp. rimosus (strain ATCC / DSM 40260/ JCM 4667 / NRRL 2234) OX=1265868 GN=SRIM_015680 PE=4 SV=1 [Streptomyces rimosus subsp. rimosus]
MNGDDARERFQDTFTAVWTGRAESDNFNKLVLRAGLNWRQAMVLRAYAKYLRQAGSTFSQTYMEDTLSNNVHTTRLLVSLFEARMSPERQRAGTELTDGLLEELDGALDQVASLDEDRILRSFLTVIKATLRTNHYQKNSDGEPHTYLSIKLDPQAIPDLPAPRPAYEIWVYSPRDEGVHLRFGKVARGGLRWSDRREDFRTEVLGLVKAQMVKNTVIVPVGAEGRASSASGCRTRRWTATRGWPRASPATRRSSPVCWTSPTTWSAARSCTRRTSYGTTRTTRTSSSRPTRAPRRSPTSPTRWPSRTASGSATRSRPAAAPATTTRAWASPPAAPGSRSSGTSASWASTPRPRTSPSWVSATCPVTCSATACCSASTSGWSPRSTTGTSSWTRTRTRPPRTPSAAGCSSCLRSSWADYGTSLLSQGGGVHPRTAKSIPINAQVRAALDLEAGVKKTPADLMRAILQAPVDLLWNGGIGTYVKSSAESHADVGDKSNDAIRVNGEDLRVKVVGEGGNLGLTQLGRIEFDRNGGKINTDAIDNSAGVDTSDHEVNIKILLNSVVTDGDLTVKQRNKLLADMTDEVGSLVLRNNYAQNTALALAQAQCASMLPAQARFIRRLERDGHLDRALEFLPSNQQIKERLNAGRGLTQPETAVLLAYTKITVSDALIQTGLPDDPYLQHLLHAYFPSALREKFAEQIDAHALRREIVTTVLVNDTVNSGGTSFLHRMREETGASLEEVVRAHTAARAIFGLGKVWDDVEALDNIVAADVQTRIRLHSRRLVERGTRWLLNNRPQPLELSETIDFFADRVADVWAELPKLLRGGDLEWHQRILDELTEAGVPMELATRVTGSSSVFPALSMAAAIATACRARTRWPSPRSTTTSVTGCASTSSWTASWSCRATTAGSRWPAPPSARTSSPRTRR